VSEEGNNIKKLIMLYLSDQCGVFYLGEKNNYGGKLNESIVAATAAATNLGDSM
jgi:hypothetical protein